MALRQYDIARLVHHYLVKEGYESVAELFVSVCPHLSGLKVLNNSHQGAKKLPRLFGPSLLDLFEEYLDGKDQLVDELEELDCVDFRPQDSLPTLLKTLVRELKQNSTNAPTAVPKQTIDASVNTEPVCDPVCDASVNTEPDCDPSAVQSSLSETVHRNDEDILESVDFAAMYGRMLEDKELHEKLAESINKNILNHLNQSKTSSDPLLSSTSSHEPDSIQDLVKAVVEETEADPLFDNILSEFLGRDEEPFVCPPNSILNSNENEKDKSDATTAVSCPPMSVSLSFLLPNTSPTKCVSEFANITETQVISPSKAPIMLNSYALVTSANGQVTLIPSVLSTIPTITITPEGATEKTLRPKRPPIAIAPKPPTPIKSTSTQVPEKSTPESKIVPVNNASDLSAKVDSAVKEAIADFDQELSLIPCDPKQPPIKVRISAGRQLEVDLGTSVAPSIPATSSPATSSPAKGKSPNSSTTQPSTKASEQVPKSTEEGRPRRKKSHVPDPGKKQSTANPRPHVSLLSQLVKLANEAMQEKNGNQSAVGDTPAPTTIKAPANKVPKPTLALQSVPRPVLSTPSRVGRRSSHVRVLDFDDDSHIGAVPSSTSTPWDSHLRQLTAAASGPSDSQIFSTPKGKAKRARKSSPKNAAKTKTAADNAPAPSSSIEPPPQTPADDISAPDSSMETDSTGNNTAINTTVVDTQNKAETSLTTVTVTVDPESVTAQLLREIVNSPAKETNDPQPTSSANDPGVNRRGDPVMASVAPSIEQPFSSSLFTPQKPHALTDEGTTSSTFVWNGEVPRTPQIKMEGNSSSSPLPLSLTKGFHFLPTADSPNLAATPLTPFIHFGQSSSVETPFADLNRMHGTVSTPRIEALRSEAMESPGRDASNTMISPTQCVLGRSTPYFVPSGERSRAPFQQVATPEHQPEERTRRVPNQLVGPLRLEDAAGASTLTEGGSKSTAAQPVASLAVANGIEPCRLLFETPLKNDENLENILIGECQRLDSSRKNDLPAPSASSSAPAPVANAPKPKLREKYIELFGEDSTMSAINGPSPFKVPPPANSPAKAVEPRQEIAPQEAEKIPPKNATRSTLEPSREAISAWWKNGKAVASEATSNKNPVASATVVQEPDSLPTSSKTERRAVHLLQEEDSMASEGGDNEEVIQELLLMASKAAKIDTAMLSHSKALEPAEPSTSKGTSQLNNDGLSVNAAGQPPGMKRMSLPNLNADVTEDCSQDKARSSSNSKTRRRSVAAEVKLEPVQPKQQPGESSQKRKSRSVGRKSVAEPAETIPDSSGVEAGPKKSRRPRRSSTIEDRTDAQTDAIELPEDPPKDTPAVPEMIEKPGKSRSRRKSVTKTNEAPVTTDIPLTESEAKNSKLERKVGARLPATSSEPPIGQPDDRTSKNIRRSASPKLIAGSPSKKATNRKKGAEKIDGTKTDGSSRSTKKSLITITRPERVTSTKLRGSPFKTGGRSFRSPPKLFKSVLPPYGRKAVSFRQSAAATTAKSRDLASSLCENNNKSDGTAIAVRIEEPEVLSNRPNDNVNDDVENLLAELHGESNPQTNSSSADQRSADAASAQGRVEPNCSAAFAEENLNFDAILSDIAANDDVEADDSSTGKDCATSAAAKISMVRPAECSPPYPSLADVAGRSVQAGDDQPEKPAEVDGPSRKVCNGSRSKLDAGVKVATRKSPRKRVNAEVCSYQPESEDRKRKPTSVMGQTKSNCSSGKLGNYLELMKLSDDLGQDPVPAKVPAEATAPETTAVSRPNNFDAKIVMTSLVRRLQKRLVVNNSDFYTQ